jgi:dienelactone hydrolase
MLALRFSKDPLCTSEKFDALDRAFNDDQERIKFVELPGRGHSVLTLDFIRAGQPAQDALENVIDYFSQQLTV